MNDIANNKYSALASEEEVNEIKKVLARMTAGGFVSTGKGREARPLNDAERFVIATIAAQNGLDPLMGDIYLLGDKPYVSTAAMLRAAVKSGVHAEYRMARPEERVDHDLDPGELMVVATLHVPGRERPITGYGYACIEDTPIAERGRWVNGKKEVDGVIKRILRRMAATRAFRDALRLIYSAPIADEDSPRDIGTQTAQPMGQPVSIAAPAVAIQLPQAQVIAPVAAAAPVAEPEPVKVAEAAPVAAPAPAPKPERAPRKAEPAPEPPPVVAEPEPEEYQQPRVAEHELAPEVQDPFEPFRDPAYDCVNAVVRLASEVHAEPGVPSDELDEIVDCLSDLRDAVNARMCPINIAGLKSARRVSELAAQANLDIPPTDYSGMMICGLIWSGASAEDAAACTKWLGSAVNKRVLDVFKAKTESDQRTVLDATRGEWQETEGGAA